MENATGLKILRPERAMPAFNRTRDLRSGMACSLSYIKRNQRVRAIRRHARGATTFIRLCDHPSISIEQSKKGTAPPQAGGRRGASARVSPQRFVFRSKKCPRPQCRRPRTCIRVPFAHALPAGRKCALSSYDPRLIEVRTPSIGAVGHTGWSPDAMHMNAPADRWTDAFGLG